MYRIVRGRQRIGTRGRSARGRLQQQQQRHVICRLLSTTSTRRQRDDPENKVRTRHHSYLGANLFLVWQVSESPTLDKLSHHGKVQEFMVRPL